jgi:hypothetical protein
MDGHIERSEIFFMKVALMSFFAKGGANVVF